MYKNKLINDLSKRKVFKKNIYNDNNDEGYIWDDYDTIHYYTNENEDEWFLPKPEKQDKACQSSTPPPKPIYITIRHTPKFTKHQVNLHKNEKTKTLLTWETHHNTKSTQTLPQFYFPGPSSNFNFQPFNTDLIL